ncbi:ABC transporter permease [Marinivivus vitaminiproducens]|uniref:ABC transporter permease n=1 Tax=Marinivivus vitaminiproducens TaxID=3035935 RepID=UPI0027A19F20|nr:ABC transporter permease [Geminicoccaceae bacterium SCSIO 64248]
MLTHVTRSIVEAAVVLLVMSFVVYGLIGLMPGDPVDLMVTADPSITSADVERLRAIYGVDGPLLQRYGLWLGAALQGDLGLSRTYSQPVLPVLLDHLGPTLLLMGASLLLAVAIALPLGILAALAPRSPLDGLLNLLAFASISVPSFWLSLVLIVLFSVQLGWLPAGGVATVGDGGLGDRMVHLVLPVAALTVVTLGPLIRHTRAAMIEALRQDYVRTAQAKGASRARIVLGHALGNAMLPIATILALNVGGLVSGALAVETIFAYRGMGKLIYDSIMANDFNLALVGLLLATLLTLLANVAADVVYAWLDPRIAYG